MTSPEELLRASRAQLLTCEAIGWIHMAGKAHPQFISGEASDRSSSSEAPRWEVLQWARTLYPRLPNSLQISGRSIINPGDPGDLLEKYEKPPSEGVLGLLQAAHAMASGVEKNTPGVYQKQRVRNTWLTTAFGHPVRNLLEQRPSVLADGAWPDLLARLGNLLDTLKAHLQSPPDLDVWRTWRDEVVGPEGWLRESFTSTLAETRIPSNDVTLWDQSVVAASLFKAAAAGAILDDSHFNWDNTLKQSTRWRVLTVGLGAEHYEHRAVRIGDWLGTRVDIQAFFEDVCQFLEVDLALGACIYRDERVLAFTFPGPRMNAADELDSHIQALKSYITSRVDELAHTRHFETPPDVQLSAATRSFVAMAGEVRKARDRLEVPLHRRWSFSDDGSSGGHVCPVSMVRKGRSNASEPDRKQSPAERCQKRRIGRRNVWQRAGGDTIWITEVADEHDRAALLTFSLDLAPWLDGSHLDSLRSHAVVEWATHYQPRQGGANPIDRSQPGESLQRHLESVIASNRTPNDQVIASRNPGFTSEPTIESFFKKVVEDRSSSPTWDALDNSKRAKWLAHQLFRKDASPGRIHRFWRSAQTFFQEALTNLRMITSRHSNSWRTRRLVVKAHAGMSLHDGEVYAGHLAGLPDAPDAPFELLYRSATSDFITVCNLARFLRTDNDAAQLVGRALEARDDEGVRHRLTIDATPAATSPLDTYSPLIVLEQNPERFRVLVPLSSAEACIAHLEEKWRVEMARVWDRLPLRVGEVAFPRKTPFQAVIEAARNLEDDLATPEAHPWRAERLEARPRSVELTLVRPDEQRERVEVPIKLGDEREDIYYPYVALRGGALRELHDFEAPQGGTASIVYRWISELRAGDEIVVAPSRYASLFLDTTARRFEPSPPSCLSDWRRRREIWSLATRCSPSQTSALAIEGSLRDARARWTDALGELHETAWRPWVRALLCNEWNVDETQLATLLDAASTGILEDALSWNLHVLKRKIGEQGE
jgi:CRISPR-associated Csx11 family protein